MEKISAFLTELRPEFSFDESENFIEDGLLDSFDIISLISMIEEEYGIKINGLDIVPENFGNVSSIISLIEKSGGKL